MAWFAPFLPLPPPLPPSISPQSSHSPRQHLPTRATSQICTLQSTYALCCAPQVLTLFVLNSPSLGPLQYRELVFFHMAMMSALTLIIQGTTTKPLLRVRVWGFQGLRGEGRCG